MKYNLCLALFILIAITGCSKKATVKPVVKDTTTYHLDGDVNKLYYNNPNGVNIVVLGDGFIKADLNKGGNFDTQVKNVVDYLFTVAPFKQNKQNFNVYTVYAESQNRGATNGYTVGNQTKFSSYFDKNITRLLIDGNMDTTNKYVNKAVSIDKAHLIVMVVNDKTYGGSGGQVAVVSTNELSKYIMVHEIGHTFAGLADEYVEEDIANDYPLSYLPNFPNVDDTFDPGKIKWAHFLDKSAYNGIVSAYEGGYFRQNGVYRPEQTSVMLALNVLSYNAPSREAIARRIDQIIGVTFDFNKFLTDDAISIQPVILTTINPGLGLPKHDFLHMKERLLELRGPQKQ
jgi:hypothetical protein